MTAEAKNIDVGDSNTETPTEDTKGLSLRDALEVAHEALKENAEQPTTESTPAVSVGVGVGEQSREPELPALMAPAEWNAEEKADFTASTRKQQEAALRLHKSRLSKIEEIKAAQREYESDKKLAESLRPYLKAMGGKESSEVALQKALKMWREFEEGDPDAAAAAYLKAKGRRVPKELLESRPAHDAAFEEKISPLQKDLEAVKMRIAEEDRQRNADFLQREWAAFDGAKNAAGTARFPDLGNTEAGLKLASNIGSLVRGDTEFSRQFIAHAKARIPDLDYQKLLLEAYRYCGGRVDDSQGSRTQDTQATQKHIARSARAASSRPGSSSGAHPQGTVRKFKTTREAMEAALAQLSEN